jgi:prepilin-type N-terminal cleavage/methylation domain-containing protein
MGSRSFEAKGMTLIELCVVIGILGVLFVLAVASVKRAQLAANESNAIGALRTITKAQFAYAVGCAHGDYTTSFVVLASKPRGVVQGYLGPELGGADTVTRQGYTFSMRAGKDATETNPDCMGNPTQTAYYAWAVPEKPNVSGTRSFATTQGGAIWQRLGSIAPPEPFAPPTEPAH